MEDDKNIKAQQDKTTAAGNEDYEIQYLVNELGVSKEMILLAIKEVGKDKDAIEAFLKKMKG